MALVPATGHLLVATSSLLDENFSSTVILLCQYGVEEGAFGLVINRPTRVQVEQVLPDVAGGRREPLWVGGPVDGRSLWVLHRRKDLAPRSDQVQESVWFGARASLIRKVLATNAPDREGEVFRLFVGYAGWGKGQLEAEIDAGAWKVVPAGPECLFTVEPKTLHQEMLMRSILLSNEAPQIIRHSWLN